MGKKKNNQAKKDVLAIIITMLIGLSIGILIYLITVKKELIPDYASGIIDTNAIKEENPKSKKETKDGSGSINLKFSDVVSVDKNQNEAQLYFKNPGSSTENVKLYLIIRRDKEEIILGESEMIPPGYAIYKIKLSDTSKLVPGGYNGILKTIYYNEKSNAREMIDSEINVKIEVK